MSATGEQSRQSTAEQTFQVDFTLSGLKVPAIATWDEDQLRSRPASVVLQVETKDGVVVAKLPPVSLEAGAQSIPWDDTTTSGAKAPVGSYVARVVATSSRMSSVSGTFALRR